MPAKTMYLAIRLISRELKVFSHVIAGEEIFSSEEIHFHYHKAHCDILKCFLHQLSPLICCIQILSAPQQYKICTLYGENSDSTQCVSEDVSYRK